MSSTTPSVVLTTHRQFLRFSRRLRGLSALQCSVPLLPMEYCFFIPQYLVQNGFVGFELENVIKWDCVYDEDIQSCWGDEKEVVAGAATSRQSQSSSNPVL